MRLIAGIVIALSFMVNQAFAFEDCLIYSDEKLSNIKIEYKDIIDVFPLVTINNDKKFLIIHPQKVGKSRFIVTRGNEAVVFNVNVKPDKTEIEKPEGFEILTIDQPYTEEEYEFEIDEPPMLNEINTTQK